MGVPKGLSKGGRCDICEVAKHTHHSFPRNAEHRAAKPLELVYTDVLGPVEDESLGGAKWAVMFTDEYSRYRRVYTMPSKAHTLEKLKEFEHDMEMLARGSRIKNLQIEGLRSDNGGEYDSKAF